MNTHNSPPANQLQDLKQPGTAEVLAAQTRSGKHCYVGVRCKSCLQEGRTTWLLLKYLGVEGGTPYKLVSPPAPRMARFQMYCETCDVNDVYTRNEAQIVNLEKAPSPEFVNQY
jgi:hypothetical protein